MTGEARSGSVWRVESVAAQSVGRFISRFNGTLIFIGDTLLNGRSQKSSVDVLAAYNAARDPDLWNAVTLTPFLVGELHPTQAVAGVVRNTAGTFREQ